MTKHGWFCIPGHQTGERDFEERIAPLRIPLGKVAKGATVLDLGCAEGLIGKWLVDQGARWLDGLDLHGPYLETARKIMHGYPAVRFQKCDFDYFDADEALRLNLLKRYDIVLVLNIAQKLRDPRSFLFYAANLCQRCFVLSLPAFVIDDVRSANVKVDPVMTLAMAGFQLQGVHNGIDDPHKGHLGIRMFFERLVP